MIARFRSRTIDRVGRRLLRSRTSAIRRGGEATPPCSCDHFDLPEDFTTTAFVETLPASSRARTVIVFGPRDSGTPAIQDSVPVAVPLAPRSVAHVTATTGLASVAVP